MVCQMELTSHLLTAAAFDSVAENEMNPPGSSKKNRTTP